VFNFAPLLAAGRRHFPFINFGYLDQQPLARYMHVIFFFFLYYGGLRNFLPSWLQTMILLISASQGASITGVSHKCPAIHFYRPIQQNTVDIIRVIHEIALSMPQGDLLIIRFLPSFRHRPSLFIHKVLQRTSSLYFWL
jgi:hypothetical protein